MSFQISSPDHKYIAVVLDGHAAQFLHEHVSNGRQGGWLTAHHLKKAIRSHFDAGGDLMKSTEIIVKIFGDIFGQERYYSRWSNYRGFLHGFHSFKGQFEFVDVGPTTKGLPDYVLDRIERATRFYLEDTRCCELVLGIPQETKYMPLLQRLVGDDRVTLVDRLTTYPGEMECFRTFKKILLTDCLLDHQLPELPPRSIPRVRFQDEVEVEKAQSSVAQSLVEAASSLEATNSLRQVFKDDVVVQKGHLSIIASSVRAAKNQR